MAILLGMPIASTNGTDQKGFHKLFHLQLDLFENNYVLVISVASILKCFRAVVVSLSLKSPFPHPVISRTSHITATAQVLCHFSFFGILLHISYHPDT